MFLLNSDFRKDILLLLVVTIFLVSLTSIIIGYLADYYFGDTISGLLGEYGEYDLALILDKEAKERASEEIEDIIENNFPGSELILGVEVVGKTNFFIKLASKYRNRDIYIKIGDYFENVSGLNSVSIMTEPRITIRGLNREVRDLIEDQVDGLAGVDFSFPDGDKLEIIIKKAELIESVTKKVQNVLNQYQVLSIRFPITQNEDEILELSDELVRELNKSHPNLIENITTTGVSDLDALVKTMTEMKRFLEGYATKVTIALQEGIEAEEGQRFIVPAKGDRQVILRVTAAKNQVARAVVEKGDSREILTNEAYFFKDDQLGDLVGEIQVDNPRQELAYAVSETTKLLPRLDSIFQTATGTVTNLINTLAVFKDLEDSIFELQGLNQQLKVYKKDIDKIELDSLRDAVSRLDKVLTRLVKIVRELNFFKEILQDINFKLKAVAESVSQRTDDISASNLYRADIIELEKTILDFSNRLDTNTTKIIRYINQYNPILEELVKWQEDVRGFNNFINKVAEIDRESLKDTLGNITDRDLVYKVGELNSQSLQQDIVGLREDLAELKKIDLASIIKEIEYIDNSLPKLKDEEITDSIDLIDKHIQGQVIPGTQITLLLPSQGVKLNQLKNEIKNYISNQITIYSSQAGLISPDLRGQISQILGEVKGLLTAFTAIILTLTSLIFDHTLIINSIKIHGGSFDRKWYSDEANYYGFIVGALTLGTVFYLSQARIPYVPSYTSFLFGGVLGIFTVNKAEVMNKISDEEFRAGQALGFTYGEIMREIIVPSGKPGILKFLNRKKTYF
ncbi:hypothetical protein BX659_101224 [Orenia metallireducens]|jgi:hypothetical protein|uniref:hypothetical protein n=1 Tax=Orenia metallireducens TaxID=1413210 RepID=UPI000D0845CA|nr:hypothetical protein [Orenia metallireducens]PRX35730.1 hypothetical protein BX659_101224 [Orenia metallireducens]